jgi:hypothetical protein
MTLVALRVAAPKALARVETAAKARLTALKKEWPTHVVGVVHNAVAAAAASTAADQISKRLMARGTVPAVVVGLAGAAAARTIVDGGFKVGLNLMQKKAWDDKLVPTMVEGARRGAINGGLTMLFKPVTKGMKAHYGDLGVIKLAAATGAVRGTIGGATNTIANPRTWEDGMARGVGRVAINSFRSGVQGAASSAVSAKVAPWAHAKFDKFIDFTSLGQGWFLSGQSGDDGLFWKLFDRQSGGGGLLSPSP